MHCNSPILNYKTDQHILLQKFKTTFRIYYIWMGHLSSQNLNGLSKYLGYSNLIFMKRSCPDQELCNICRQLTKITFITMCFLAHSSTSQYAEFQ